MKPKPSKGQRMFLLNVGNNARNVPQTLAPADVVSVGRKYFTVVASNNKWLEVTFSICDWRMKSEYAPCWAIYSSEQEWKDEKEALELHKLLREAFYSYSPKMSLQSLRDIKAIIDNQNQ